MVSNKPTKTQRGGFALLIMKHQPPNTSDKRSNKFLRSGSIPPPTTSHGGRYTIRRSGLSIFVVILSSVSIALFTGRMASSYMHRRQQRELQPQCQPAHTMLTEADENIINYEALVHPAMITHLNPKRVAVVGGKQQDATLREVYKHVSVQDAFILGTEGVTHKEVDARTSFLVMNDQTCSSLLFDVIIDPNPVKVTTDFSPYFNCLDDDGMVSECHMIMIYCVAILCLYLFLINRCLFHSACIEH